jgi:hypothetical protein
VSRGFAKRRDLPSSPRWPLGALCVVALAVLTAHCAPLLRGSVSCQGVQVRSEELTLAEAERYCRQAVGERQKVEDFWGATWSEPIRIHVSSAYRISRALVPGHLGDRGFVEMPLSRARGNTGALLHEIVHVYAPNNNRFLAEGLAIYLHARLASNPAFPNFGQDLHRLAAAEMGRVTFLAALNSVRTPRPLGTVIDEKAAYVLAGSFVGFLIERYELARFRTVYETENYDQAYGKSLADLEWEWRSSLRK